MTRTLSIDPGASTGWALFDGSDLTFAGVLDPECAHPLALVPDVRSVSAIVTEYPEFRPGDTKSNPNDLITLAMRAGVIEGMLRAHAPSAWWRRVRPSQWKGSVPKPIHNKRVLGALTAREMALLPNALKHDTIDAVGIGLWHVGRMGRGGRLA